MYGKGLELIQIVISSLGMLGCKINYIENISKDISYSLYLGSPQSQPNPIRVIHIKLLQPELQQLNPPNIRLNNIDMPS